MTQADVNRARRIARWYSRRVRRADESDLEGAALEGLAKAARDWNPEKSVRKRSFWSFACTRMIGEMRDELRRLDHLTRDQRAAVTEEGYLEEMPWLNPLEPMPLDAPIQDAEGQITTVVSLIPDPREPYAGADDRDGIKRALALLTEREREVFLAIDYLGIPNLEVASRMGFTEGRASQIRSKAAGKMRAALGPDFRAA